MKDERDFDFELVKRRVAFIKKLLKKSSSAEREKEFKKKVKLRKKFGRHATD